MWVKSSIVENGIILNQSIDHYGMVLQIASYLLHKGFSVDVNHHDDADIVATMNDQTIAIEYERPGSHTVDQLIEKNQRLQTKYGRVVFVVTSTNFKVVSADNCIGMEKTVTRGIVLREYLENLVHEFKRLKPVNQ